MAYGTLSVQVPADDGAIQRAFEQLDAQMDAWLAAMTRVEQALAGAAAPQPQEPACSAEPPAQEAQSPPAAQVEIASPAAANEPEPITASAPASVASESVQVPNPSGPADASVPAGRPVLGPGSAKLEAIAVPVQKTPKSPSKADEDEALLATLDEETAKAIRVMRRMCMSSKSVKDLLAEYRAKKQGRPVEASPKKSWFRR